MEVNEKRLEEAIDILVLEGFCPKGLVKQPGECKGLICEKCWKEYIQTLN